ncbi:MAG: hypothetical protein OQK73_04880 [Gammaproteobacteria bacterium]|nr:hypothetical protein [Gammaproteobacteria bacterium]
MNDQIINGDLTVRRILMDIDAWGTGVSFMQSAFGLASHLEAELFGLFVEDAELLQAAELPFTREISLSSAQYRDLDASSIIRHMQVEADKLRRQMELLAATSKINWSLNIARGERFEQVFEKCNEFELIIFMPGRKYSTRREQGPSSNVKAPAVLLYKSGTHSLRALHVIKLLMTNGAFSYLKLLTLDNSAEKKAKEQLEKTGIPVNYVHIPNTEITELTRNIMSVSPGLIVFPFLDEWREQPSVIKDLLDKLPCPLILVR